jgi:RadC-like JAB domain
MYELKVVRERRAGYGALTQIRVGRDVFEAFRGRLEQADREEFFVLPLDGKNKVLGFNVVSVGTLTSSLVHPRECFKHAILANAASSAWSGGFIHVLQVPFSAARPPRDHVADDTGCQHY